MTSTCDLIKPVHLRPLKWLHDEQRVSSEGHFCFLTCFSMFPNLLYFLQTGATTSKRSSQLSSSTTIFPAGVCIVSHTGFRLRTAKNKQFQDLPPQNFIHWSTLGSLLPRQVRFDSFRRYWKMQEWTPMIDYWVSWRDSIQTWSRYRSVL